MDEHQWVDRSLPKKRYSARQLFLSSWNAILNYIGSNLNLPYQLRVKQTFGTAQEIFYPRYFGAPYNTNQIKKLRSIYTFRQFSTYFGVGGIVTRTRYLLLHVWPQKNPSDSNQEIRVSKLGNSSSHMLIVGCKTLLENYLLLFGSIDFRISFHKEWKFQPRLSQVMENVSNWPSVTGLSIQYAVLNESRLLHQWRSATMNLVAMYLWVLINDNVNAPFELFWNLSHWLIRVAVDSV